jgi:hypothetical protein
MNKKNVNLLLKKSDNYYNRAFQFKKVAIEPASIVMGIITAWSLLGPTVARLSADVAKSGNIAKYAQEIINHLNGYEKDYGFKNHAKEMGSLRKACQDAITAFNAVSGNPPQNPQEVMGFIKNLELYLSSTSKIESLAYAVRAYLDEMKNFGGKAISVIKDFGFDFGLLSTHTIKIQSNIDLLLTAISMNRPSMESKYQELKSKAAQIADDQSKKMETSIDGLNELSAEKPKSGKPSQVSSLADFANIKI